jgi:hypothetical protein
VPIDGAATATYTPLASDVGARLVYEVTATDALGSQSARSAPTAAVEPQPVDTPRDTTAPSFTKFALTRKRFRVAKARTPVAARKAPKGTKLSYALSEPAGIRFTIYLDRKGRIDGRKRCRIGRKKGRRCILGTQKGRLTRNAPAGASTLAFSGRVGKRALKPGSYEIRAVARDAAGNVSKPKAVSFKIVR